MPLRNVISLISPVRGVPTLVLRVIPAPHGKANADVNAGTEHIVGILNSSGLSVEVVCTDGNSKQVYRRVTISSCQSTAKACVEPGFACLGLSPASALT
jgi:hypothetical protein